MAGKPLDRFAGGAQYPLETPSKRNLRNRILGRSFAQRAVPMQ